MNQRTDRSQALLLKLSTLTLAALAASSASAEPYPSAGLDVHRSLLAEADRAELERAGPLVDFGTADQHKYTHGGWLSGWNRGVADEGAPSYAAIHQRHAQLHFYLTSQPREIVMRARSALGRQRVTIAYHGKRLGSATLGSDWRLVRIPAAGLPESGRAIIDLEFSRGARRTPEAEVDWLWLASDEAAEAPALSPRVGFTKHAGTAMLSLLAPSSRTYSFYLEPPADSDLVFAHGSSAKVGFAVSARTSDGAVKELFGATSTPGKWTVAKVDLRAYVGRVVRLELTTTGAAADTAWGLPAIAVARPAPAPAPTNTAVPAKNVVVVVLDACRADMFSTVNPDSKVNLPSFDALAAKSSAFVNAYNNESWTKPSTTSFLTAMYPHTHKVYWVRSMVPKPLYLLSEHLDAHGFRTAAVTSNPVVGEEFGFNQGWDDFINTARTDEADAEPLYGKAIDWLGKNTGKGRFFLYIQSMECHTPYASDREYSRRYHPEPYHGRIGASFESRELGKVNRGEIRPSKADYAWIRALYHGEASYQDVHVGKLLAALADLNVLDETIVVITNDHGEELDDHGNMGHTWSSYEELVRAPLLIHYPPMFPAGKRFEQVVEQLDVAPTLLEALALPPLPEADGESFLAMVRGRERRLPHAAVIDFRTEDRVIRVGRWKLTINEKKGWSALYDLVADPGEAHNRKGDRELAGRYAEIYLGEALAEPRKSVPSKSVARKEIKSVDKKLDKKTRKELEALGYVDKD